MKQSPSWESW